MINRVCGGAVTIFAALLLARCGGSQPPGAIPQGPAIAAHARGGASGVLPGAESGELLYVSSGNTVYALSYPAKKLLLTISLPNDQYDASGWLCSDANGNVFVPAHNEGNPGSVVYEYAHGETNLKRTLTIGSFTTRGCGSDRKTGNLAVAGYTGSDSKTTGAVAVFKKAQGSPTIYNDSAFQLLFYCGYDQGGNLFVDGPSYQYVAELPYGGSGLNNITFLTRHSRGQIQWDGTYMTMLTQHGRIGRLHTTVFRFGVAGSIATIVGKTTLSMRGLAANESWIDGSAIVMAPFTYDRHSLFTWKYPAGGKAVLKAFPTLGRFDGLTISVAPSH